MVFKTAYLLVKRIELTPESLAAYNNLMKPISLPYKHTVMSCHEIPKNTLDFDLTIGENGHELPSLIRFCLVRRKGYLGSYSESAFNFLQTGLRSVRIKEADQTISQQIDYFHPAEDASNLDSVALLSTTSPLSSHMLMKEGSDSDAVTFANGYAVIRLDLTRAHVNDHPDDYTLRSTPRYGPITLSLDWGEKTKSNYELIIQKIYDKSVEIDSQSQVVFS